MLLLSLLLLLVVVVVVEPPIKHSIQVTTLKLEAEKLGW